MSITEEKKNGYAAVSNRTDTEQYLNFTVGNEIYGLEIHRVKEILEFRGCTRMPMVPEFIRGVINLRGHVVPVIDMAKFFFGRDSEITRWSCVVIVEQDVDGETMFTGILVDSVRQVLEMQQSDMEPVPDFGTPVSANYIKSLAKTEDALIIILKLDTLLAYREATDVKNAVKTIE
jgi:purine-binding chemotaxis protein CheW